MSHLFCFGLGYSARALGRALMADGWRVSGTVRSADAADALRAEGFAVTVFDGEHAPEAPPFGDATHLLSSVPPGTGGGEPVLDACAEAIARHGFDWVGYLSTTGVYGDTGGAVVDETAPVNPTTERSRRRAAAEARWLALWREHGAPVHVFRLAGIYGPGRSPFDAVRAGQAKRIDRPDQLFSRIHVDDIVCVLRASMRRPNPGAVYNVCDDEPAAPADVTAHTCRLLGVEPPPLVPFDAAKREMSAMALSFWRDNRRVDNRRLRDELGVVLAYPHYRAGLAAVLAAEEAGAARAPR